MVDPQLLARHKEIAFNAGRLDTSIVLNADDYERIATPLLADISAAEQHRPAPLAPPERNQTDLAAT